MLPPGGRQQTVSSVKDDGPPRDKNYVQITEESLGLFLGRTLTPNNLMPSFVRLASSRC
jgi:hypothetical protein